MHSVDQRVLARLLAWLRSGQAAWLCTIVATYGSSPRPVGSLFACNAAGETAGSLSGGCVEEDLLAFLATVEARSRGPHIREYGLSAQDNERLGLPCGGSLQVLVEALDNKASEHIAALLDALNERRYTCREVEFNSGERKLLEASGHENLELNEQRLRHTFGPRYRLLLVGAGQLSCTLAELAVAMDYQVLVCDPRQELLQQWDGPPVQLVSGMPDDAVRNHALDGDSIVLTLTHDPRIDDMALMEALQHPLFYIGALGSQRTSAARRERLLQLDITEQQLQRLHAPVGLDIGSKTPMEIAVAILAQLTQLRRSRQRGAY